MREQYEVEEITFAAKRGLKEEGHQSASKLISEALFTTPTRASKIREAWQKSTDGVQMLTVDEAVSLIVEAKLSRHQYLLLRKIAKSKNANIYPPYTKVLDAKKRCYPSTDAQILTESMAEIRLQDLLDHTVNRVLEVEKQHLLTLNDDQLKNLVFVVKWGYDGSTGHSQYKQRFEEAGLDDGNMFLTSIVPLQLYYQEMGVNKNIVWQNPRPSSTRYCRPIRFQFKKESVKLIVEERKYIEDQISKLSPTAVKIESREIAVRHSCILSMIDGKVCNALSDTSSAQACFLCKATPKEMNDIDNVLQKKVNKEYLQFGLSSLHAWIRFFECLLHVSYRLHIKKWQVRGEENVKLVSTRKKTIQSEFKSQMGLLVDFPKIGGSGTSNDGNTARKFFKNPYKSAEITGIDVNIITRFDVVLSAISCGHDLNLEAFERYCIETARIFVRAYPRFYMPASVHKILLHGPTVVQFFHLPIGQLSEEAQESRNKDLKKFRELHTRKMSRITVNQDLLNRLLVSSDPLISSLRQLPRKNSSSLPKDVINLLKEPDVLVSPDSVSDITEESENDSDSDYE